MKSRLRSALRLPFLPVWLAPFILLSPVLLTGQALFWGVPSLQFVPWWSWAWHTLQSGHLPLWNPLVGMGAPLLANYQSALFYPATWIYFLLAALGGVPALAWGMALVVALHMAWAGIGMVLLVRRLGLSVLPQAIAGLAFGLSGYLVARSGFLSINAAVSWVPWILLAALQLVSQQRSWRPILWLALFFGLQLLAGHAQTSWYTILLVGMWTAFWGGVQPQGNQASRQEGWRSSVVPRLEAIGRDWLRVGLALLIAIALAAVQLLPTAEYLSQSQRAASVDYEFAMTYSAWPWRILTLFAPDMFGNPARGDYWGYATYWEDALYIGLLPVLLALGVLLRAIRRRKVEKPPFSPLPGFLVVVGFLAALILLSFLLALGKNTPVFPWLYRHVPTFSMFQAPARFLLWAEFALVLLAALGAEAWRRPQGRALYWTRLGTAGGFAVCLGAGLGWFLLGDISPSFVRATALAGLWAFGAGVLSLLAPVREVEAGLHLERIENLEQPGRLWHWAVIVFVSADLLVAGWGLNPGIRADFYGKAPLAKDPPVASLNRMLGAGQRLYLSEAGERHIKYERFFLFSSFQAVADWSKLRQVRLPDLNLLEGLPSANNFDPLVPGRYARWMEALQGADLETRSRMLNLMNVGVVERVDKRSLDGVRYAPRSRYEQPARLHWVPCARLAASPAEALQMVLDGKIDFQKQVVLEGAALPSVPGCQAATGTSPQLLAESPNQIQVHLSTSAPSWLVLSDVWYPGWRAWVDGKSVPVYRANYLFRAVPVSSGEHTVVFAYRPWTFWLGLSISTLSWLGLIFSFVRFAASTRLWRSAVELSKARPV